MTINFTFEHIATFVSLVAVATVFFKGGQLIRMIAWLFLWQLLTPVRGWLEDGLMIGVGFWLLETSYKYVTEGVNEPSR